MSTLLLVIDLQKNFINEETKYCHKKIKKLLDCNNYDFIAFTKFINDEDSNFYKTLNWKGCMTEEDRQIMVDTKDHKVFEKRTYTAFNKEFKDYIKDNNIDTIYLCGIDTDACVLKTALDLFDNDYNVKVIEDCSMSHSGYKMHESAINILKKNIGSNNVIKAFKGLTRNEIKKLIDYKGGSGCIASDEITLNGKQVGFMYRDKPNNEYDSGWNFFSGKESEKYTNNPDNFSVFDINTICNYDDSIIEFLNKPVYSAFIRDENGNFVEDKEYENILKSSN